MAYIQHFSRQYPVNIINIVSVIFNVRFVLHTLAPVPCCCTPTQLNTGGLRIVSRRGHKF